MAIVKDPLYTPLAVGSIGGLFYYRRHYNRIVAESMPQKKKRPLAKLLEQQARFKRAMDAYNSLKSLPGFICSNNLYAIAYYSGLSGDSAFVSYFMKRDKLGDSFSPVVPISWYVSKRSILITLSSPVPVRSVVFFGTNFYLTGWSVEVSKGSNFAIFEVPDSIIKEKFYFKLVSLDPKVFYSPGIYSIRFP